MAAYSRTTSRTILYIHHQSGLGGAPTSLLFLIKNLDGLVFKPIVIAPPGPAADLFEACGIKVYRSMVAGFYHVPGNMYKGFRWLLFLREFVCLFFHLVSLARVIILEDPVIVHLNDSVLLPAGCFAKIFRRRVVWHIRSPLAYGRRRFRRGIIRWIIWKCADLIIAISQDIADEFGRNDKMVVVHNSVDLDRFKPLPSQIRSDFTDRWMYKPVRIGLVSRIHREKGSFDFISAAEKMNQLFSSDLVRFFMVGGAVYPSWFFKKPCGRILKALRMLEDYETIAREMVHKANLDEQFVFVDFVSKVELIYRELDVVVFPSHLRSIGRAALEASACGKPVVATTVTRNQDVVVDGVTGFLVPQGDVKALSCAMGRLVINPLLRSRMGKTAYAYARMHFDPLRNARRVMVLYDNILKVVDQ